jgi:hypothetical protein
MFVHGFLPHVTDVLSPHLLLPKPPAITNTSAPLLLSLLRV